MPYTTEEFIRDVNRRVISEATLQDRLEGLSLEDRIKGIPKEEVLKSYSLEEIEAYVQKMKAEK